jgi:hypothetical protein
MGRAAFTLQQTFTEKSHSIQGTKGWVNPRLVWICWQRVNPCPCWKKNHLCPSCQNAWQLACASVNSCRLKYKIVIKLTYLISRLRRLSIFFISFIQDSTMRYCWVICNLSEGSTWKRSCVYNFAYKDHKPV